MTHVLSDEQIADLTTIVGAGNASIDPTLLARLARTTLPEGTEPTGVVWASSREQVQKILVWASARRVPIYPVSTGKNWGYGDSCASVSGCLLIDLSRMNRILEVDATLAYAVVEPGVTQGQLAQYLAEHNLPLMLDATGAGPDASLIGNIVERGFGHTAYGDRFAHCTCTEAVLPDGSAVATGFGAYRNARARHVYKWGIGPSLDGLLTQSNLAVVTQMTIWLMPRPQRLVAYYITLDDPAAIRVLIDRLRPLRLAGTLRSTVHCFSARRLLASATRFPWDRADGRQALEVADPAWVARECRKRRIPEWVASGSLAGTPGEVRAARRTLRQALRRMPGLERIRFLDEKRLASFERVAARLARFPAFVPLSHMIRNARLGFGLLSGKPGYETLKGGHWRGRKDPGPTQDALESESGLVWVSPVLPMTGSAVEDLDSIAEPIFHRFGFEYQVAMTFINERSICAILALAFDHGSSEETTRARDCEAVLLEALLAKGYIPYRGTPSAQAAVRQAAPGYWAAVAKLKEAWDPMEIIAPGRYVPRL